MTIDPALTGVVQRATAPLWISGLRSPETVEALAALGLEGRQPYFAARAAPLGAVPAPVVVSTFFNFSPAAVAPAIPSAWSVAAPEAILAAQLAGMDAALRAAFDDLDPSVVPEAAALARTAAEAACEHPEGRPLFSAYAALDWPDEAHLVLWHAHYLLREFRGDGHIAALTADGITGVEAHIVHIAAVPDLGPMYRPSRGWTDAQWDDAMDDLRARGWLEDGDDLVLTPAGTEWRMAVEDRTDALAVSAYDAIGTDGCERLAKLGATISAALIASGRAMVMPAVRT